MIIQWFPGHMTKALRKMEKDIKLVDLIVYVLDARAPFSCVNPKFHEIAGNKPIIYVLNKSDLADENKNKLWQKFFSGENSTCITLNSTQTNSSKILLEKVDMLLSKKNQKYEKKGVVMVNRAMVIGVPNSGKSTLINNVCGKYKAKTGNKPGVTKGTQWVRIGGTFELLDTPGTLWPSFDNQEIAKNLAYIGSIRDAVVEPTELSLDFIEKMKKIYPELLKQRYGVDLNNTPVEILEQLCENRKYLIRGGEVDYERGANALFDDFRKGRIGKITLETPKDYE